MKSLNQKAVKTINNEMSTMAISNYLFLLTSKNPLRFLVWRVLAKLIATPRNYS